MAVWITNIVMQFSKGVSDLKFKQLIMDRMPYEKEPDFKEENYWYVRLINAEYFRQVFGLKQ